MGPGTPGYIEIATTLAKAEMRMLNDERAVELADLALPEAQNAERDDLILDLLITRAVSLSNLGRSTEASAMLIGALDMTQRRSMHDLANRAATNLGYVMATDDPARAYQVSLAALDNAMRAGVVWGIRYLLGNALDSAIEVGKWDWALEAIEDREFMFTEAAERLWFGTYRSNIHAYRGLDVGEDVRQAYASSRAFDDPQFRVMGTFPLVVWHFVRRETNDVVRLGEEMLTHGFAGSDGAIYGARSATWDGDLATAKRMRDAFVQTPPGRRTDVLRATMDAGIAAMEGRMADARSLYAGAQRTWREMGLPLWLAMCNIDIVMTGALETDERRRAADEAREILTTLRADALLAILDQAVALDTERSSTAPSRLRQQEQVGQEA